MRDLFLGFQGTEKVDGTPNLKFLVVVIVTLTNHLVLGILIDDESCCDVIYIRICMKIGLRDRNLTLYEGLDLLALNDSFTLPCGIIGLLISFKEKKDERIINMHFLVIPCKIVCNNILERSFFMVLYAVASPSNPHENEILI